MLNKTARFVYLVIAFLVFCGSVQAAEHRMQKMSRGTADQSFDALMDKSIKTMHERMGQVAMNGVPDHDFAAMMIPHHQGAIDMAGIFLRYGKDFRLSSLARRIIGQQRAEIKLMQTWLDRHKGGPAEQAKSFTELIQAADATMHAEMEKAQKTGNPDHDFVTLMIPHHQGAIAMAKGFMKYGKSPVLLRLARGIVTGQEREIAFMDRWLKSDGSEAPKHQ
jgi:uncharacterized protein (DUF305 family)